MYYFGCVGNVGHHCWTPELRHCPHPKGCPWVILDLAALPPPRGWRESDQTEGMAHIRYLDGWTLLGFWDRSVDHRFASSSVFVTNDTLSFDEMVKQSREAFPSVWERFNFEVVAMDRVFYLDDVRNPGSPAVLADFTIARNLTEARNIILSQPAFPFWSLDHDLGPSLETGMDFLKWAAEHALDKWPKGKIGVHSANPVGAENMMAFIAQVERELM